MEVLHFMNSKRLLDALVFGGGTMLRLCYELNRYSVDLDFYFRQEIDNETYFQKLTRELGARYRITDHRNKFHTILVELKGASYPRRLKIEINKKVVTVYRPVIAFSPGSTYQVMVNAITPEQMLLNKIAALIDRKEIRDAFDVEFLLRRGMPFPDDPALARQVLHCLSNFTDSDFRVKLGSLLPPREREYYRSNRFIFLEQRLKEQFSR